MKFDASVPKDLVRALEAARAGNPENLGIVEAVARVRRPGDRHGEALLVWHYVFYSELSLVWADGRRESLSTSVGDEHSRREFERLSAEWALRPDASRAGTQGEAK